MQAYPTASAVGTLTFVITWLVVAWPANSKFFLAEANSSVLGYSTDHTNYHYVCFSVFRHWPAIDRLSATIVSNR